MIKYIKIIFQIFLLGNLFTGVCAIGLSIFSFNFFAKIPTYSDLATILGTGLFISLGYQFPYLFNKNWFTNLHRSVWIARHFKELRILFTIELIIFLYLLVLMNIYQGLIFIHLGILGWLYYSGFSMNSQFSKTRITLRNLPYMKTICISYVWAVVTIGVPLQPYWHSLDFIEVVFLIIMRFILIAVLCLIFDLRDIATDTQEKVPTVPVKYGFQVTYWVIFVLLIFYMCGMIYKWGNSPIAFGFSIIGLWILALLYGQKRHSNDYFYLFLVDGTMLLPVMVYYTLK